MQKRRAITFDFHDTLASCDRWFDLEVRSLPAAVVERLDLGALTGGRVPDSGILTATYRSLRGEIIGHGVEMDAVTGVVETLRRHAIVVAVSTLVPIIDDLMRECLVDVRPKPGAVAAVRTLADAGFALGVVSSAVYHPFLIWVLDAFGLLPAFQSVVTSASAGFYKSRPEIYQRALRDLAVDACDACHVGDSVRWDHLTAKSLGFRTVLVSTKELVLEPDQPAPDLHLPSLLGAGAVIAELANAGRAAVIPT